MNVLLSPEFTSKVKTLSQDEINKLYKFISLAEEAQTIDTLVTSKFGMSLLENDIFYSKIGTAGIYYTVGEEEGEDYLLLLDIVAMKSAPQDFKGFFTPNDPKSISQINPLQNSAINPNFNMSLNPRQNTSINPLTNSSINPRVNSSINPKVNSSINPKVNSSINPKVNSSINPQINTSLNPRSNRSYGGPYLYDTQLNQIAFLVRANNRIELLFNPNAAFAGFMVSANNRIKIEFDVQNDWTGFYVKANEKVWLKFSPNNQWLGLLV